MKILLRPDGQSTIGMDAAQHFSTVILQTNVSTVSYKYHYYYYYYQANGCLDLVCVVTLVGMNTFSTVLNLTPRQSESQHAACQQIP